MVSVSVVEGVLVRWGAFDDPVLSENMTFACVACWMLKKVLRSELVIIHTGWILFALFLKLETEKSY